MNMKRESWLVLTWSLTLTGLPLAGANSKPHNYQQKVQKKRTFRKYGFQLNKNRLMISDQKKIKKISILAKKQNKGTRTPHRQQLYLDLVNRKKTGAKLKSSNQNETVGTWQD